MIAIYNNKYESVKTLLKLGADPNLHDTYTGKTAVIVAAENDDLKYLRLLLNYKGDPNSIENTFNKKIKNESTMIDSAITASISVILRTIVLKKLNYWLKKAQI
ncbi:ankyrin repeat domain-containing protein [Flavobacterium sp.]|uniref:ankyrin repeat domain-containing protein n=1 Tax=Flavobacterium sp. TaxID=239 RepID=UPI0031CF5EF6